jgi:prepilin-type N-terminal cleavage/methylation domain-containing protein
MHRRSERGFSLMEITVVLAIVSLIMIVVYTLIEETMQVSMFNESHNDLAIMSQSAVNTLQAEVMQTRVAFEENATGAAYRAALAMPAGVTVWADSLLPVFHATGDIAPDAAAQRYTGNSLLLARQLAPLAITYDHDGTSATPEIEFLADRYRFEYVFLARTGTVSFSGSGMSLDLTMTTSGEYADYFQIASMGSAATGRIVLKLMAAGLQRAWNPGQPVNNAFYTLAGATDGTFDAPLNAPTIATTSTQTLLRGLLGGRISGRMNYSVAFGTYPIPTPVRVFAQGITARPGFPSGFEVKVAGPARNRQVMTRLVLMSHYGGRTYESQQAFVVTAARF